MCFEGMAFKEMTVLFLLRYMSSDLAAQTWESQGHHCWQLVGKLVCITALNIG
jgi:hypothetical protein